jgi:hypothetical protein
MNGLETVKAYIDAHHVLEKAENAIRAYARQQIDITVSVLNDVGMPQEMPQDYAWLAYRFFDYFEVTFSDGIISVELWSRGQPDEKMREFDLDADILDDHPEKFEQRLRNELQRAIEQKAVNDRQRIQNEIDRLQNLLKD